MIYLGCLLISFGILMINYFGLPFCSWEYLGLPFCRGYIRWINMDQHDNAYVHLFWMCLEPQGFTRYLNNLKHT
jgi:hypothetical protein